MPVSARPSSTDRSTTRTTSSKPSDAAPPSWTTTTTAGSTSSCSADRAWPERRRRPPTVSTATTATARSPTSPKRPDCGGTGWASAVAVGDYNNDGFEDLFITYWGQNVLYRNNGDGTFTDVTEKAGLLHGRSRWGSGCTFVDYDRDGQLDLFVASYLEFDLEDGAPAGREPELQLERSPRAIAARAACRPGTASLYRNNGDGTFTDVSAHPASPRRSGSYAHDRRRRGLRQRRLARYLRGLRFHSQLSLPQQSRRHFHARSGCESGVALNEDGKEQAGMGVGIGDYDLDGSLDIFKTHFADDTSILYRNDGKGDFDDVTIAQRTRRRDALRRLGRGHRGSG